MSTIKQTARATGNPTKKIRKQERAYSIARKKYRKDEATTPRKLFKRGSWSVKKRKTTVKKTSCRRK